MSNLYGFLIADDPLATHHQAPLPRSKSASPCPCQLGEEPNPEAVATLYAQCFGVSPPPADFTPTSRTGLGFYFESCCCFSRATVAFASMRCWCPSALGLAACFINAMVCSGVNFKGKQIPVADIAKTLGVAYVLDGSERKSGARLRVSARLIRADSGYIVWSETYDRSFRDILMVRTTSLVK
jgi:hypothetical protein